MANLNDNKIFVLDSDTLNLVSKIELVNLRLFSCNMGKVAYVNKTKNICIFDLETFSQKIYMVEADIFQEIENGGDLIFLAKGLLVLVGD